MALGDGSKPPMGVTASPKSTHEATGKGGSESAAHHVPNQSGSRVTKRKEKSNDGGAESQNSHEG